MNPIKILAEICNTVKLNTQITKEEFLPLFDLILEDNFPELPGLKISQQIGPKVHLLSGYIYTLVTFNKIIHGAIISTPYIYLNTVHSVVLSRVNALKEVNGLVYDPGTEFQANQRTYFVLGNLNGRHFLTDFQ